MSETLGKPARLQSVSIGHPATRGRLATLILDAVHIWQDRVLHRRLLAYSIFVSISITAAAGVSLEAHGSSIFGSDAHSASTILLIPLGILSGILLAALQRHLRRRLGLVPFGATTLSVGCAWTLLSGEDLRWAAVLVGVAGGLLGVSLHGSYRALAPANGRRLAMAMLYGVSTAATAAMLGTAFALVYFELVTPGVQFMVLTAITGIAALLTWLALYRDVFELGLELVLWPIYRIRAEADGFTNFPLRGPVLVVANHTSWMDPLWLAKVLPRRITPMMTSVFYDLPVMRWFMVHMIRAIRVEASYYRREAPELRQAIAALDRGECVLIFPEGWMRRREDQLIRPFAQGAWHILSERPQTPVVVCWIEGGWGSFFSYCRGLPTKNKRLDWWRTIRVSAEEPQLVDPRILSSLRATRNYLMNACMHARRHLGLCTPVLQPEDLEDASTLSEEQPLPNSA